MSEVRPRTMKLRNATPNINLPLINSTSNKFNWKTLSESNVYILKKLPEVTLKEASLSQLDKLESNKTWTNNQTIDHPNSAEDQNTNLLNQLNKIKPKSMMKKEFIKQNSSFVRDRNIEHHIKYRSANEYTRPTTNQKLQVKIKCYLCNNEFNAKQIIKHETDCLDRWKRLSGEEKQLAIEAQKEWLNLSDNQPNQWKKFKAILEVCSRCGRNFFEHRLEKHELNCKGRGKHALSGLNESDEGMREKLEESIVFVRKTKPLNRSTQFYKLPDGLPNQMNATTAQQSIAQSSPIDERIGERTNESSQLSNMNLISQPSSLLTGKMNSFYKCEQCGRVLNKSNMQTHIQFHARSSNRLSEDLAENCSSSADKAMNRRSNSVALDAEKTNLNNQHNYQHDEHSKNHLINQLTQQFNPINQSIHDRQMNQLSPTNQVNLSNPTLINHSSFNKTSSGQNSLDQNLSVHSTQSNLTHNFIGNQPINGQLMFNEEEWSEHLKQLKKCSKCNRTFFANRIKKHQSTCKAPPI